MQMISSYRDIMMTGFRIVVVMLPEILEVLIQSHQGLSTVGVALITMGHRVFVTVIGVTDITIQVIHHLLMNRSIGAFRKAMLQDEIADSHVKLMAHVMGAVARSIVDTVIPWFSLMDGIQIGRDQVRQIRDIMAMGSIAATGRSLMGGISSSIRLMVVVSWVGRPRCFSMRNNLVS
jgi:hypothetical protein